MKNPDYLLWCDLETNGLDPTAHVILEIALKLTEFKYPWKEIFQYNYIIPYIGLQLDPFIIDMHTKSGLLKELEEEIKQPDRFTWLQLKTILINLSDSWKDKTTVIAGNSVHFDLSFLRSNFPEFTKTLHYRIFDVSAISLLCRSLGMPETDKKESIHRAKQDIENSIEQAKICIKWLSDDTPMY